MNHADDCSECDGSGFFVVYFESEGGATEYNCACREALTVFELCDECEAVNYVTATDEHDLRIDVYTSGVGTKPHVRIVHLPTGLVAECGTERSQLRALAICMDALKAKLAERDA
jgi:protein subunit release factor A